MSDIYFDVKKIIIGLYFLTFLSYIELKLQKQELVVYNETGPCLLTSTQN